MVKRARSERRKGEVLNFDVASRHAFLTGFRKRKQERRKKAMLEAMEQERKDRIEVRKELRNDVKQRWKDVQLADRRVLKLLDRKEKALAASALAAGERSEGGGSAGGPAGEALATVEFDREENDPFGDCEVTTTDLSCIGDASLWPVLQGPHSLVARAPDKPRPATDEDWQVRFQRRQKSLALEEVRRKKAMARDLERRLVEKQRAGRKKPKGEKKKGAKNKKSTARARRRRK